MSSVSSSTTSLVSSSSSSSRSSSTKDYAAAFASLQSSFGANGMAPRAVPKQPKKAKHPTVTSVAIAPGYVAPALPKNKNKSKSEGKNYEAAFGALSSQFGTSSYSVAIAKLPNA